jgi:mannan endo-1,4-beta-mannosidase
VAGLFAIVGVILIVASHAATLTVSIEAESGTVSGAAGAGDGTGASGSASVKFGTGTTPTPPTPPPSGGGGCAASVTPANTNASPTTKNFLACMYQYKGKYIMTGQMDNDDGSSDQAALTARNGGVFPAIHGYDHIVGGVTAGNASSLLTQMISEWNQFKEVPTISQHWSPSSTTETKPGCGGALKTAVSTTDIMNPSTSVGAQYAAWKKNMGDDLATLSAAGVPVLFRPYHEAGNKNCFWWSQSTAQYVALWKDTFAYMNDTRKLDNIIWVFNTLGPNVDHAYYPGDQYVDIIGGDNYTVTNGDFTGDYNLYKGYSANKPVAVPEVASVPAVSKLGSAPLVFEMTWSGSYSMSDSNAAMTAYFADSHVIDRNNMAQYVAGTLP